MNRSFQVRLASTIAFHPATWSISGRMANRFYSSYLIALCSTDYHLPKATTLKGTLFQAGSWFLDTIPRAIICGADFVCQRPGMEVGSCPCGNVPFHWVWRAAFSWAYCNRLVNRGIRRISWLNAGIIELGLLFSVLVTSGSCTL